MSTLLAGETPTFAGPKPITSPAQALGVPLDTLVPPVYAKCGWLLDITESKICMLQKQSKYHYLGIQIASSRTAINV